MDETDVAPPGERASDGKTCPEALDQPDRVRSSDYPSDRNARRFTIVLSDVALPQETVDRPLVHSPATALTLNAVLSTFTYTCPSCTVLTYATLYLTRM